jgi:hypothetical protein
VMWPRHQLDCSATQTKLDPMELEVPYIDIGLRLFRLLYIAWKEVIRRE